MLYKIIETSDGFMVEDFDTGEYLQDSKGNNLFDSYDYALSILETYESVKEWEQL